jgi:hypothetical protein
MSIVEELPLKAFDFYQGEELIMRLGVGFTLYFARPFKLVSPAILNLWKEYTSLVAPTTFTWARLGGGNRSRKAAPPVFRTIEAWLAGTKDYGDTCWISLHDGPFDCLGEHSFMLTGYPEPKDEFQENAGFLDIVFPVRVLDDWGSERLADALISLAAHVPFYCGVAGYVFHRSPYKFNATLETMGALSKRFEGVEISASERLCYLAPRGLTTVNWLTFVGVDHLARLGGEAELTGKLRSLSQITSLPHGIVVKTGETPVIGDRNKGHDDLAELRKVYRVLQPAQFTDPVYAFHDLRFDGQQTIDWLTRLGT